ncbi:MAG: PEP-CTERM sorting domain-containing protein [Komarekiella atlantica HA4396-MV6]|nr:PEP-CTERM sorting domain-containing protein [Komarekiella atlantica HA4396-MV6]
MSGVVGETKYKTTTPFGANGYNLITAQQSGNHAYCAGCNGSFLLDFTQTTVGNALGVFGAGFDILYGTQYFAQVTFGDDSTQDFSLAGQNFWGITSEKSIKGIHVGLQGGGATTSGSILIDNLTIGGAKSVPEPASVIGILAFGAFGASSLHKRKQQQNATAKV